MAFEGMRLAERKVLVLDDEVNIVKVVTRILEVSGYQVLGASGLDQAAEVLRRSGPVDCALLDFSLEGVSCSEAFALLRKLQPGLKVVLASGFAEADVRGAFPEAQQCAAFLKKPFGLDALVQVIGATCDAPADPAPPARSAPA